MGQHDSPHVFHNCAVLANSREVVHDHDKCVPLKYRADIPLDYVTTMATYIDQVETSSSSCFCDRRLPKRGSHSLINLGPPFALAGDHACETEHCLESRS